MRKYIRAPTPFRPKTAPDTREPASQLLSTVRSCDPEPAPPPSKEPGSAISIPAQSNSSSEKQALGRTWSMDAVRDVNSPVSPWHDLDPPCQSLPLSQRRQKDEMEEKQSRLEKSRVSERRPIFPLPPPQLPGFRRQDRDPHVASTSIKDIHEASPSGSSDGIGLAQPPASSKASLTIYEVKEYTGVLLAAIGENKKAKKAVEELLRHRAETAWQEGFQSGIRAQLSQVARAAAEAIAKDYCSTELSKDGTTESAPSSPNDT